MAKIHLYAAPLILLFSLIFFCFPCALSFSEEWSGTGFLVGGAPVVVTNHHVAAGARQIEMTFRDGRTFKGRVLRLDKENDLAVIGFVKPPKGFTRLRVGSSDTVRPGQEVYVMGYPMPDGLGNRLSITKGIIASTVGMFEDNRHFRVTAEINPGNSGGPLLDTKGRVIGVVSHGINFLWAFHKTGQVPQGTNFAIKSSLLRSMLSDFEEDAPAEADLPELTGDEIFAGYRDGLVQIYASTRKPEKPEKSESEGREEQALERAAQRKATAEVTDKREAVEWAKKSRENIVRENWAEAIRTASAAMSLDPGLPGPYADRCFAYYKKTLYEDAASDCDMAIKLDHLNDLAYSYRALVNCEQGFIGEALADALHAMELSPKNLAYRNNRGVVYERQGKTENARADYEEACRGGVEIACKNFTHLMGYPVAEIPRMVGELLDESRTCFNNGQMDRVIEITTKVIKLDPRTETAYANRAGAYARKGLLREAVRDCDSAIRINPNSGLAFNNKGFAFEKLEQTSEAVLNYEISCGLHNELGCKNYERLTGKRAKGKE